MLFKKSLIIFGAAQEIIVSPSCPSLKNDFCCRGLQAIIEDPDCPLKYRPYTREFIITIPDYLCKKNTAYPSYKISHCPRCGEKFPESLSTQWYEIIEHKFGVNGLIGPEELKLIPEEYKTDQWWKKRNL